MRFFKTVLENILMKKQFIIKVKETLVAEYLVEADENADKETFDSGNYEIIDTLDDGLGNLTAEEIESYKEAE